MDCVAAHLAKGRMYAGIHEDFELYFVEVSPRLEVVLRSLGLNPSLRFTVTRKYLYIRIDKDA